MFKETLRIYSSGAGKKKRSLAADDGPNEGPVEGPEVARTFLREASRLDRRGWFNGPQGIESECCEEGCNQERKNELCKYKLMMNCT